MPSMLLIQWGVFGFFVAINFLLGFFRGTSKSLYFTVVSIFLTIVTLIIVSSISLNWFLSATFTFQDLIALIQGYLPITVPADILAYLIDPALTGLIVAIIDLVIRVIAFFSLYPVIKSLLTLIIFKPIWKRIILKKMLAKQNEKEKQEFEEDSERNSTKKKFVPRKRLNKNIMSRFFGGMVGSVRGAVVGFIFLLPVLVFSGFIAGLGSEPTIESNNNAQLGAGNQQLIALPSMVQDYLDQVKEMNEQGLASITSQILIEGKSIDRYVFDMVFTVDVYDFEDELEEASEFNFGQELESILGIATILMDGGYLDEGYDFNTISSDNLGDIEQIFTYISKSNLLGYMIPFATQYGIENFMPDDLAYDFSTRPNGQAALDAFTEVDWSLEFMRLYDIIEATLEFGSLAEIMGYLSDPTTMLELTAEQGTNLANIVRAFGNLESLAIIHLAADFAVSSTQAQDMVTWVDPADREAYLTEELSFIFDNADFFIGETGQFARIANLIDAIFTDEFGDVDLTALAEASSDPTQFLALQNEEWISNIFTKITEIEMLVELIPLGVDYALYSALGDQVDAALADEISTAMNEIEWDTELQNIGSIYIEATKLGIAALGGDTDTMVIVDEVVTNHMDTLRLIVEKIFEDSQVVNAALELASPAIIDQFVTDELLNDVVTKTLMSDPASGVVDFNFGQEINNILDIVESIYLFTSASELTSFSDMILDDKIQLFSSFGSLTPEQFAEFSTSFEELQIIQRLGTTGLEYLQTTLDNDMLYIPAEVDLGNEITTILGLVYTAAAYTYDNRDVYPSYEEIDFAPLLADEVFRSYLIDTPLDNHSDFLIANIAHNVLTFSADEAMSAYIAVPSTLALEGPESAAWATEVNALIGAIFDIGASFEGSTVLKLTLKDITTLQADSSLLSLEVITQFSDLAKAEDTFSSLDSSQILRTSLVSIIDSTLGSATASALNGYEAKTPVAALDGDMLKLGMFVEFIHGLAVVADDMFNLMGIETLGDFNAIEGSDAYLSAFSGLQDESIEAFSNITIIRGVISEMLMSAEVQSYLVETVNTAQDIIALDADFFALDPILLDVDQEALLPEEVTNLLLAVKAMGLTDQAALDSLGPDTFTLMIDRNIDLITGEDDFDRVLNSGFIFITLDKMLQLDGLGDFVGSMLSDSLGVDMGTFDLSLPAAMLGNAIDHEEIEVGRIPKEEFRNIINAIGVLGDVTALDLNVISNLVDPYSNEDDLTTVLESDFIYIVLARLFDNDGIGSYVSDMLGTAFGDDPITLEMGVPEDAKGLTGVEEGLMTKVELRNLMISFSLLGLADGTDVSIGTIMDMLGGNEVLGVDDFDRFLNSKFLSDKISQMLLSDQVKTLIAAGRFDVIDFVLPSSATVTVGTTERLTNDEIYALFNGMKMLGITDAEFAFEMSTLTSMTTDEVNTLLSSTYLYVVLDLMIKSEDTLTLPGTVFEIGGDYDGMVKKSEITDIFLALSILGVSDLNTTPDPATITLTQLNDLLEQTDSGIVQYLISQAIIDALGSDAIPIDAFDGLEVDGLLTNDEIDALVAALTILAGGDESTPITEIDTANITVGQVADLSDSTSVIIKQLLSDAIVDAIGEANIPDEAYGLSSGSSGSNIMKMGSSTIKPLASTSPRLSDEELDAMIDALLILANGDEDMLITAISTDVNVGQASQLKTTESHIIKQLISDAVIDVLPPEDIPVDAYIDSNPLNRLKDSEISAMIDALVILANGNLLLPVTDISTDVTVGQVNDLDTTETGSVIIKQLITNSIVDVIDPLDEGKIPTEAYDLVYTGRFSNTEIDEMINALVILADGDMNLLVTAISTDVTVGQVKQFKGTGSYTIKQLVSDAIIDSIGLANIPDDAFIDLDNTNRLSDAEIDAMIDALDILAEDNVLVTLVSTDVTIGQAQQLNTGVDGSATIKKIISDAIIDMIDPLNEGKIPAASYHLVYTDRLSDEEIGHMIDVLGFLGDETDLVTSISTDINIGQLKDISTSPSLIMKKLISDSITDAVGADNVPLDARIDEDLNKDLTQAEIDAMVIALEILAGSVVPGDVDHILVASVSTDVTIGQAQALDTTNTGSSIIKQMISDSIITMIDPLDEGKIPAASYHLVYTDRLSDEEIGHMLDVLGFLGDDADLVSTISTDINIGQLKDISTSPSLIMKKLISDSIIDAVGVDNVPLDARTDEDLNKDLTQAEVDAMIIALEVLAGSVVPGDVDHILVASVSTDVTIGQAQALDTTNTGSSIIKQMISDSIITMIDPLDEGKIPAASYHLVYTDRLSDEEIGHMLDVLGFLGDDADPVSTISTDINIGQLKDISTSPSLIMKKLISDSIIDAVGLANVPDDAYIDENTANNLTQAEVDAMIIALEVLAGSVVPGDVDHVLVSAVSTDVTIGQTQALDTTATGSSIIKQMISDSIITMIGAPDIPADAYHLVYTDRLSDAEIGHMLDVLGYLGDDADPVSSISVDITIGQLKQIKDSSSLIMKKLISDSIIDAVGLANVPDDAYIDGNTANNLTQTEVDSMVGALEVFAGSTVPGDKDLVLISSIVTTNVTVGQTQGLKTNASVIIKFMISDSVITMFGAENIPDEAYHLVYTDRLSDAEVSAMIDALSVLGDPEDSVTTLSTDITVGQTQDLDTTATGSVIIKQMISDSIVDMLTASRIPDSAHIDSDPLKRLTDSEIGYMQESLLPLAGNDENVLVSAITVTESTLSVSTLQAFPEESIILNRMISTALIDGIDNIPDESYTELVVKKDIKRPEIDNMLDALVILNIGTSGAGSITTAQITFAQLDQVAALGSADLVNYPDGYSPLIVHILSEPMIASVTDIRGGFNYGVPTTAYRNTYDLKYDELLSLIAGLKVIGNVPANDPATTTLAAAVLGLNPSAFGPTMLANLIAVDSLVIYRMISIGINDSNIDTLESHTIIGDVNHDAGLPGVPAIYDVKIAEMNHIVVSMNILGITNIADVATSITVAGLQALTPAEIELLVEAGTEGPNTIIYYLISETVDPSNNLFDTLSMFDPITYPDPDVYYVYDGPVRVRLKRSSIATALSEL